MFIDEATVRVRGGRGGNGVIHFVSGPKNPRGGPDGGNAGHGGSVLLEASRSVSTLYRFRHRPLFEADNGVNGSRNNKQGATGADLIVLVTQELTASDEMESEFEQPSVVRFWGTREIMRTLAVYAEGIVARGRPDPQHNGRIHYYWT